jgi:hypothetical protein
MMQLADATTADTQLRQDTPCQSGGMMRTDPAPSVRYLLDRNAPVSHSKSTSATRVSRVIVEGELGTWHERDAIDPAIPDFLFSRQHSTCGERQPRE